jgi:3-hydroxyisobutyrate dehydrogenase
MLPASRHVREVWLGGLAAAARADAIFIDCSTIDVAAAREVAAAVRQPMLDAPVSGGVMGAENATLTFMVGGEDAAVAAARPVLEAMGRTIVHCGAAGAGQAAKACNNMLLAISMIGTCEAFLLAEKLGLSHQALFDVASKSSGQCWSLTSYSPWPGPVEAAPSNRNYEGGFLTSLMLKDLKLAQEAAARSGATAPLGAQAEALYALFDGLGYGAKDFSAMLQLFRGKLASLDG